MGLVLGGGVSLCHTSKQNGPYDEIATVIGQL